MEIVDSSEIAVPAYQLHGVTFHKTIYRREGLRAYNIKMDLTEKGSEDVDWIRLTQDRVQ
jgi:hypothetical protein